MPLADGLCPACRHQIANSSDGGSASSSRVRDYPEYITVEQPQLAQHPVVQFRDRLLANTPHVWVTRAIVAVNVVIFIAMTVSCGELFMPGGDVLIKWGSDYGPLTLDGQPWRLVTSMFVHIGIIHLAFNMWVLWDMGHLVERLVGNVGFILLYFISGILGSMTSVWWNPSVNSAGASGAVFGVFGALMGFMALRRDSVPKHILVQLRSSGLTFLGLNLVFGFSVKGIDMAAHIGGLLAGFLCGLAMSHSLADVSNISRTIRNSVVAVLAAVGMTAAFFALPAPPSNVEAELAKIATVENQVVTVLSEASEQFNENEITKEAFVDIVDKQVLAPWREASTEFEKNIKVTPKSQQLVETLKRYILVREQGWKLYREGLRDDDAEKLDAFHENQKVVDKLIRQINLLTAA